MIGVIDYGTGNVGSVVNMIRKIGGEAELLSDPKLLRSANKLLLPGVGAFDHGRRLLADSGWDVALYDAVIERKVPILGICLGMQLMCKSSEEGRLPGLGWVDAQVLRFNFSNDHQSLKIPHMGWNVVKVMRQDSLVSTVEKQLRFYFVHSYYVKCSSAEDIIFTAKHGVEFVAGFHCKNIWGVQFHPEKSHRFGMELFRLFTEV